MGVGECDPFYEDWASRQAATAAILAWRQREPVTLACGRIDVPDLSFNRTRPNGVIDPTMTLAELDRRDGSTLAVLANFAAHPTVWTELMPHAVTRDIPGLVCDSLEAQRPGAIAMYLQGACGDVNFHRHYQTPERCREPAERLVSAAKQVSKNSRTDQGPVRFASEVIRLPTRRWLADEIFGDRREAERRMQSGDISGWRESIGRSMTNRPDDMVRRHGGDEAKAVRAMCRFHLEWTEKMLRDLETRAEFLETEVQAVRIGPLCVAANSSELFSPFAVSLRHLEIAPELMVACYANGRIGYLPDAFDIAAKSYAGYQSPKYCNQFPFVAESGDMFCAATTRVLEGVMRP